MVLPTGIQAPEFQWLDNRGPVPCRQERILAVPFGNAGWLNILSPALIESDPRRPVPDFVASCV